MFSKRNIDTKIEAIKLFNLGKTPLELAKKFGVHLSTIYRWTAKRQQIEETKTIFGPSSSRRKHASFRIPYPEIDGALLEWFQETQAREGYIQVETIQENAIRIAREFGIEDFKACRTWVQDFKKRNKLTRKLISGEDRSCPQNDVFQFQTRLINICAGYHPRDIFNLDETSLFFRASPRREFIKKITPQQDLECLISHNSLSVSQNEIIIV